MPEYALAEGFIQFPVEERDIPSGDTVRDITIRTPGTEGVLLRITIWPEYEDVELNQGDFVAADGQFEERVVDTDQGKRTYRNLNSITRLAVLPAAPRKEREVVNKPARGARKSKI